MYTDIENLKNDLEAANFRIVELDDAVSVLSKKPELNRLKVESFFNDLNYELTSMSKSKKGNVWIFQPTILEESLTP